MSKRDSILAAATEEFATHGFAGARVQRIADAAGANKQLIYYYFGSKTGLYEALIASGLEAIDLPALESAPGERAGARLRALVERLAAFLLEHPEITRLASQTSDPVTGPPLLGRELLARVQRLFEDVISDGQRFGYFRDDVDTPAIARHAAVLLLGYAVIEPGAEQQQPPPWVAGVVDLLSRYLAW